MSEPKKDFFISYTRSDRQWAEWVACSLEQAGYRVVIQAWNFPAGSNFVYEMDKALKEAQRVIAVLTPDYLSSEYAFSEWATTFRRDPRGKERQLLPVRVQPCEVEERLGPILFCDLVECNEGSARQRLLAAVDGKQAHPIGVPLPGTFPPPADLPRFPGGFPASWNIPYPRNPFFIGRDTLLAQLVDARRRDYASAHARPQAISGLSGIGKTQIAVEYAYRYRQDYEAVFWTQADTRESLIAGYLAIAKLLGLPEKSEQDQMVMIEAVKNWLEAHDSWLLILDNADDLTLVRAFLPTPFAGHILLTTRRTTMGRLASCIKVETMSRDVGALFLLRRAALLALDSSFERASLDDGTAALQIAEELGGLPLALDQAGAYLEETQCSPEEYLELYRVQGSALLSI